jgi:hypothetical protein
MIFKFSEPNILTVRGNVIYFFVLIQKENINFNKNLKKKQHYVRKIIFTLSFSFFFFNKYPLCNIFGACFRS